MKVSQSIKFHKLLKFLQVQSQKTSSTMMNLDLMRTATGKEDPELPLLQRINSLEVARESKGPERVKGQREKRAREKKGPER